MNRPGWMPNPGAALALTLLAALAGGLTSLVVTAFNPTPSSGTPRSHSLRVRELVLVDSKGVERAVLGSMPGGVFGLRLRDGTGRDRMHFLVTPDSLNGAPALALLSKKGDNHASLTLDYDDNPSLGLIIGGTGSKKVGAWATLQVRNQGQVNLNLRSNEGGTARLSVNSSDGGSAALAAYPGKMTCLSLSNPSGEFLQVRPDQGTSRAP